MPFSISSQGTILAEKMQLPIARIAIEAAITAAKPSSISSSETRIDFKSGMLRLVSNWNLLVPITSGSINFFQTQQGVEIRYRISFIQMFVWVTAMVPLMFGLLPILIGGWHSQVPLPALAVGWFWLFGMNYLIAIFRFPAALRGALKSAASAS